ncbi:hypothetical protein EAF04_005391 [Stromatinia cepivora]|nr:hypothetical protein EAF04_005391 [Stromatinia cepivora]
MCISWITRGPCWCRGNNGQNIDLLLTIEECKFVLQGSTHDKYYRSEVKIKYEGRCPRCCKEAVDAERQSEERREEERVEVERKEAERLEREVAVDAGARGDTRGMS